MISTTISSADATARKHHYNRYRTYAAINSKHRDYDRANNYVQYRNNDRQRFAMPMHLMDNATVCFSSPPTPGKFSAVNTDTSISAQTLPIFTVCDFVFLQDISSADISLGTPVCTADVHTSTWQHYWQLFPSAIQLSRRRAGTSPMLIGESFSSLSSAVNMSSCKPWSQNKSADEDTFRSSFASDFSTDLPLTFAILGLSSYKRYTPDTFRGGGDFKNFI